MKNLFKSMMLVAAAAMGFTACSKDATEDFEPVAQATETITISTDITRTTLNADRMQLTWVAGDQFAVYTDQGTKNTPVTYTEGAVNFDLEVAAGSQTVYAYYPYFDRQNTDQYDQTFVSMYVTSTQKQKEAGVFDGNTNDYVMVAKGAIDADKHVALTFKPVACALAFNIYGGQAGEKVESVTFDPGVVCAGQHYMDITVDNPVYTAADGKATSVTVALENHFEAVGEKPADPKAFANQVYAVVARKAYEGATFTVKTSLNTYTFKTASTLDLTTDFFTMNLNLAKGEKPTRIPDGDYIIVATNAAETAFYALTNKETSGSTKRLESKSIEDIRGVESYDTSDESIKWHISQADASYVITDVNGKYISWTSGNSASLSTTPFNLDIAPIQGTSQYKITATKDSSRIFSKNTSADYFAFYTSEQSNKLYLIPAVSLPKCEINDFTATLNSEKTVITFEGTYTNTLENDPDWSISVAKDGSEIGSIEAIGVDGEIAADDYTVSEDGKYTFTLTATIDGQTVATKVVEITVNSSSSSEEYTLSITRPNFNNGNNWSSYATQIAKVTGSDDSVYSITAEGIAYQVNYIQIRQSKNSVIYNTTNLGNIKSIVIEDSTKATYNVWVGTSEKPSTTSVTGDAASRIFNVTSEGNGYFKITNANTTISNITKITVTYTK